MASQPSSLVLLTFLLMWTGMFAQFKTVFKRDFFFFKTTRLFTFDKQNENGYQIK